MIVSHTMFNLPYHLIMLYSHRHVWEGRWGVIVLLEHQLCLLEGQACHQLSCVTMYSVFSLAEHISRAFHLLLCTKWKLCCYVFYLLAYNYVVPYRINTGTNWMCFHYMNVCPLIPVKVGRSCLRQYM